MDTGFPFEVVKIFSRFNITNQGNTNQNYKMILPRACHSYYQKNKNKKATM